MNSPSNIKLNRWIKTNTLNTFHVNSPRIPLVGPGFLMSLQHEVRGRGHEIQGRLEGVECFRLLLVIRWNESPILLRVVWPKVECGRNVRPVDVNLANLCIVRLGDKGVTKGVLAGIRTPQGKNKIRLSFKNARCEQSWGYQHTLHKEARTDQTCGYQYISANIKTRCPNGADMSRQTHQQGLAMWPVVRLSAHLKHINHKA